MKKRLFTAIALVVATAAPSFAQSYKSDVRQYRQDNRIERGYYSGRLTPNEARKLQRQQDRIQRVESRARALNGGYIDPRSQDRIERMQDRANRNIARKNNNRRGW